MSMREIILGAVNSTLNEVQSFYDFSTKRIPGAWVVVRYVQKSYQDDPARVVLEALLLVFVIRYLISKKYNPSSREIALSPKEVDELIRDWQPETLVPALTLDQEEEMKELPVISGPAGVHVQLEGQSGNFLNMANYDFLGLSRVDCVHEKAVKALRKYGVGACGPPGFYGTLDVHLQLEKRLAQFIGAEEAIIYAQAYSTISGVIPAFSKRGDILIVYVIDFPFTHLKVHRDEGVSFAIQKGVQISRSTVRHFKHNDMEDLERVLSEVQKDERYNRRPLTRRFIIVEGLYQNFGDIAPLPELLQLKEKFKYRLIVEESLSFGVLGKRGAGLADHFGMDPKCIDIMASSMAHTLAAGGGFCAGSKEVVDHQRLSGASYCFSAALPAMLAVAAIEGIEVIDKEPKLIDRLRRNIGVFRDSFGQNRFAALNGDSLSPLLHLTLVANYTPEQAKQALRTIIKEMHQKHHILLTRAKYLEEQEMRAPKPSIRLCISATMQREELQKAAHSLKDVVNRIVGQH